MLNKSYTNEYEKTKTQCELCLLLEPHYAASYATYLAKMTHMNRVQSKNVL